MWLATLPVFVTWYLQAILQSDKKLEGETGNEASIMDMTCCLHVHLSFCL